MPSRFLRSAAFYFSAFLLVLFASNVSATDSDTLRLDSLKTGLDIQEFWHYHIGDDTSWASPSYDDNSWKPYYFGIEGFKKDSTLKNYFGVIWFRHHMYVDSDVVDLPLALSIHLMGACEVYIDGKLVQKMGVLQIHGKQEQSGFSLKNQPVLLSWAPRSSHLIALRITNFSNQKKIKYISLNSGGRHNFFSAELESGAERIRDLSDNSAQFVIALFSGVFVSLSLFHFMLFLFYRKNRTNLYYSLFTFLIFLIFYGTYQMMQGADLATTMMIMLIAGTAFFLIPLFFIALLYQVFYKRLLVLFWVLLGLLLVSVGFLSIEGAADYGILTMMLFLLTSIVEIIRVYIRAWVKGKDGAGIFMFGLLLPPGGAIVFGLLAALLRSIGYGEPAKFLIDHLGSFAGYSLLLSVSVSMTIYLARDFARMNRKLQKQLHEIKSLFEKTIDQEKEKKSILESQNTELERKVAQRTYEIEQKNRDITDNLNYAKRIQSAILPDIRLIYRALQDSFIIYRPKDIVSGDFYSFSQKDGNVIIAAADCTGHGVTGAFMSMIGSSLLNQIVNERGVTQPARILNYLNTGITEALKQSETEVNDGMDIALCNFDLSDGSVQFAGANRPLWIIRDGELKSVKPDKMAIGGFRAALDPEFSNHQIKIRKGDCIYLFTDGFADQFGGPAGKKMLSKRFRELLISFGDSSMREQEKKLNQFFEQWKGGIEQVDDVLVIGIRI